MVFGLNRKTLIQAAILSVALGFYHIFGTQYWTSFIESTGAPVGVGETAVGFFFVVLVAYVLSWWLTHKMDAKKNE